MQFVWVCFGHSELILDPLVLDIPWFLLVLLVVSGLMILIRLIWMRRGAEALAVRHDSVCLA